MEIVNYNVLNILKSYLPNKTFSRLSATNNEICYAPITQTEIRRRVCYIYLFPYPSFCYTHVKCIDYAIKKESMLFPLIIKPCVKQGNIHVIKYIFKHVINKRDCAMAILNESAKYGHLHIVKYAIEKGRLTLEDIREDNNNILSESVRNGHLHIVKYLFEIVGLNLQDIRGKNTYNYNYIIETSIGYGHIEIIKYLIKQGITKKDLNRSWLNTSYYKMALNIIKQK